MESFASFILQCIIPFYLLMDLYTVKLYSIGACLRGGSFSSICDFVLRIRCILFFLLELNIMAILSVAFC